MRALADLLCVPLVLGLATMVQKTEVPSCNVGLEGDDKSAYPYQDRGDRCEGMYREPRGALVPAVELVSVHYERPGLHWEFFEEGEDEVLVRVPEIGRPVALRAVHASRGVFYRMDASIDESETAFRWDTDVVRGEGIAFADAMLVASVKAGKREKELGISEPIHVPVALTHAGAELDEEAVPDRVAIWFRANTRTEDHRVQLLRIGDAGDTLIDTFEPDSRRGDSFGIQLDASKLPAGELFQVKIDYRPNASELPACDAFYVTMGAAPEERTETATER